ncbi:MAG: Rieske 2Fe-2S domain-containing protein [Spirochaetota bacterium]
MIPQATLPSSWYFVCKAKDLTVGKVLAKTFNNISLVFFRGESQIPIAMEARCSHLGADLRHATVVNAKIVCPLHEWQYNSSGSCVATKLARDTLPDNKQKVYPCMEKFSSIFVFLGECFFPFPSTSFATGFTFEAAASIDLDASWQSLASNSFDVEHLTVVHKRGLHAEPQIQILNKHTLTLQYESYVLANRISDKIMKFLSGNRIRVRVHTYGGTFITVESQLKQQKSVLIFSFVPESATHTHVYMIIGVPQSLPIWDTVRRKLSIYLYRSFLKRDLVAVHNMQVRLENLKQDKYLKYYWQYLQDLP